MKKSRDWKRIEGTIKKPGEYELTSKGLVKVKVAA